MDGFGLTGFLVENFTFFEKVCYNGAMVLGSSMVEQEAVNFEVTGSSPVRGAILGTLEGVFLICDDANLLL